MTEDNTIPTEPSNVIKLQGGSLGASPQRLPQFIDEHVDLIVGEWEAFARTLTPFSHAMTPLALRDHIHQILAFIVPDMRKPQTVDDKKGEVVRRQG